MKKKQKIYTVALLSFFALTILSTFLVLLFLTTPEETTDPRSEAAIPENDPPLQFGTLAKLENFDENKDTLRSIRYRKFIKANYEWIVLGEGKMHSIRGLDEDTYRWERIDPTLEWAEENDIKVKYHTLLHHSDRFANQDDEFLVWYDELPNDEARLEAIEEHVKTIIEHYKDRITLYDLINHAIYQDGDGNYLNTGKTLDEMYVLAFTWANEVDTDNTYIVNAGTVPLYQQEPRDAYIKKINDANAQLPDGSKIDAVGIMGHFGWCTGGEIPPVEALHTGINEITQQTGLKLHITELDLAWGDETCDEEFIIDPAEPFTAEDGTEYDNYEEYQKWAYGELFRTFRDHPSVEMLFTWGFYDGNHWRDGAGFFAFDEEADKDFIPKPSWDAVEPFYQCEPQCDRSNCGLDGCGGNCGTCGDGKWCSNDSLCMINNLRKCTADTDCIKVNAECCGCEEGGGETAINKEHEEEYLSDLEAICGTDVNCPQVMQCTQREAVCEEEQCVLGEEVNIPEYPACQGIEVNKATVSSKTEEIKITVTARGKSDVTPGSIYLLAAAGNQTNKKPENFACSGDKDSDEYSYYCLGLKSYFQIGKKEASKTYELTTNWNNLATAIDEGIGDEGNQYDGTLEEKGILISTNVEGDSSVEICSSNVARNNGTGTYYSSGKWDVACNNSCNITIKYDDSPEPLKCNDPCEDNSECPNDLICHEGNCRAAGCETLENCTCDDDAPGREDVNKDGVIDLLDISQVLGKWGDDVPADTDEDVNEDGTIDMLDISSILGKWS